MGAQASQTVKDYVTNSVNYRQIVESQLNLQNNTEVNTVNVQNWILNNGGSSCCCEQANNAGKCIKMYHPNECPEAEMNCKNLTVGQKITTDQHITQEINSEFAQQLSSQLQNTAQADIQNALDQLQKADPTSFGADSRQELENKLNNEVNVLLDTKTVMKIINTVLVRTLNTQNQTINNCGIMTGENCDFTQEISTHVAVQNILSSIGEQISQSELINKFYAEVQNKLTQKQEGVIGTIADAFSKFFGSLGTIGMVIFAVVGLVLFLMIMFPVFSLFKRK